MVASRRSCQLRVMRSFYLCFFFLNLMHDYFSPRVNLIFVSMFRDWSIFYSNHKVTLKFLLSFAPPTPLYGNVLFWTVIFCIVSGDKSAAGG